MPARLHLSLPLSCPPARARELLLDADFLNAFVDRQRATRSSIEVDREGQRSKSTWSVALKGDLPAVVRRFVGVSAEATLVFDLASGTVVLTALAAREGTMTAQMLLDPRPEGGAVMTLKGHVVVLGPFGAGIEGLVRDRVILPVLERDLRGMLNDW